jgi:hypothetical protein
MDFEPIRTWAIGKYGNSPGILQEAQTIGSVLFLEFMSDCASNP